MHKRAPVLNPELNQSKGHDYLPAPQEKLFHRVRRISGEDEGTKRDAAKGSTACTCSGTATAGGHMPWGVRVSGASEPAAGRSDGTATAGRSVAWGGVG